MLSIDMQLDTFIETPLKKIQYKNYCDVWVKDESVNLTGTHKDRMAHVIAMLYFRYKNMFSTNYNEAPICSLISAGNAALAIATRFKSMSLPKLKVLLDHSASEAKRNFLQNQHCEVYTHDILSKSLTTRDILSLTHNESGVDLTSYTLYDPYVKFYFSLVKSVIAIQPDVIIVPYGSGVLFENFCSFIRTQPSLYENTTSITLIGVTTGNSTSRADKLYSAYSPFDFNYERLDFMKKFGFVNQTSKIMRLKEELLDEAINILQQHNINAEYSGASGLSYLIENAHQLSPYKRYVIINTGAGKVNL